MSLYKYLSIDILKKVIDGNIRFTQPSAFNDPFEMLPELYVPNDFSPQNISIKFDLTGGRRQPAVGELSADFTSDNCHDVDSRNIISELNKSIGILCLSKNHDSLLMWSHYAQEYAGAVIEFDDEHEFFTGKIEVEYRDSRPKKDISTYLVDDGVVPIAELCTKSRQWEYEAEVRLIRSLDNCVKISNNGLFPVYVMNIPRECIKSIIFGERTAIEHQAAIFELLKDSNIGLSLAAISNSGYEFRHEPIKFDVPCREMSPIISPRTAHIFKSRSDAWGEIARWMIENHKLSPIVNKIA